MRIRTGRRRRRVKLLAVCGNATAVRAVAVVLHIGPDCDFYILGNQFSVTVVCCESHSCDACLLRGQGAAHRAAAGRRHEVRRRTCLNRIIHDRVRRVHRIRKCRHHRGRSIAYVEYLIREVKLRHVIVTCIYICEIILPRRHIRSHRDRREIRISVKTRIYARVAALIFLHELTERAQRGGIRLNHPVALVRHVEHVVTVCVGRTDKAKVIVAPKYFGHAVRLEEFHADTA